jgi:hypothetical protein
MKEECTNTRRLGLEKLKLHVYKTWTSEYNTSSNKVKTNKLLTGWKTPSI